MAIISLDPSLCMAEPEIVDSGCARGTPATVSGAPTNNGCVLFDISMRSVCFFTNMLVFGGLWPDRYGNKEQNLPAVHSLT